MPKMDNLKIVNLIQLNSDQHLFTYWLSSNNNNKTYVECKNKGDISSNKSDWNYFKGI
jgi:hypothetical protein